MYSLTVIIPFYNEQDYLEKSFKRLYLSNVADQIYLVDDASKDSSKKLHLRLKKLQKTLNIFQINQIRVKALL